MEERLQEGWGEEGWKEEERGGMREGWLQDKGEMEARREEELGKEGGTTGCHASKADRVRTYMV